MKKLLVLLPLFTAAALHSQTTTTSVNAGLTGFTNLLSPFLTNSLGGNVVVGNLSPLLMNLENSLLQILPTLTAFNNGFDIVQPGVVGSTNNAVIGAVVNNLSGLAISTQESAQGTDLGQGGVTATAVVPDNPALTTTTLPNGTTTTTTTTTTVTGLSGVTVPGAFAGLFGTNVFGFTNTRDALRALLVLQADVERMLPIVDAINGANLSTNITTNSSLTMPTLR